MGSGAMILDKVRIFPCWSMTGEERWLARQAANGRRLLEVRRPGVYRFEVADKAAVKFAVEYAGKDPDVPTRLAQLCNDGWDYIGRAGDKRYYRTCGNAVHPSLRSPLESVRLRSVRSNLITLLLLNLPGTLYCLAYLLIFLMDGGFTFGDIFAPRTDSWLYLAGALLGVGAYVFLFKALSKIGKRLKRLKLEPQPDEN